jgi:hypothetical protein
MSFVSDFLVSRWSRRALDALCIAVLSAWVLWWHNGFHNMILVGIERSWFRVPALGADFWTESDLFARAWLQGQDPYLNEDRLFHYPPLVLRMFAWVGFFHPIVACKIWIAVLGIIIIAATVVACRTRTALGLRELPILHALPLVLLNSAVVFEMERANWDYISIAAILVALPLLNPRRPALDFIAGCLLAVCPWVKIYPGLLGLALIALRRWHALAGFATGCVGFLILFWGEFIRSLHIVNLAMDLVRRLGWLGGQYPPWVHSLSMAWLRILDVTVGRKIGQKIVTYTAWPFALAIVLPIIAWVGMRLYRSKHADRLTYVWLLWVLAVASFVPDIANDYSLSFLPVAAIAASSFRDPLLVRVGLVVLAVWWQPFWLPIPGPTMLAIKLLGVVVVGRSIIARVSELDGSAAVPQNVPPSPM